MASESRRLQRHVIVVTGAAAGIGQAIVLRCIEEGADLVAVDRDADGLAETARLATELGGRCATLARGAPAPRRSRSGHRPQGGSRQPAAEFSEAAA